MIASKTLAKELHINHERLDWLDKALAQWVEEGVRSAVSAVIYRDGVKAFENSYGVLNPEKEPLKTDSIFHLASITKSYIACLLMMMQEDGTVDLNDPVKEYYPEFKCTGDEEQFVGIWHLLTHSGGLDDEKLWKSVSAATDVLGEETADEEAKWDIMMRQPLGYRPRHSMLYSNVGYTICLRLIEKISGKPIDEYAREKLFGPLGMTDTHWDVPEDKWSRIVRRFENDIAYPWYNNPDSFSSGTGGWCLKSTAPDTARYAEMIRSGGTFEGIRILSPSSVRCMTQNYNAGMNAWDSWGIGFNVRGTKFDDTGIVRPATAVDHSGHGGVKMLIDFENRVSWALFCTYPEGGKNVFSRFANMVYSVLDD
jgi:CubicO group peptidase (beta-lactamase class C family)